MSRGSARKILVADVDPPDGRPSDDARLCSPSVGIWRCSPWISDRVLRGHPIGTLEILGVRHSVMAPPELEGARVVDRLLEPTPVGYGQELLRVTENASTAISSDVSSAADTETDSSPDAPSQKYEGPAFVSPMSGRYYEKPSPDSEPFLRIGDEVARGQTVCLLEAMKTFTRVTYGGEGLPERARIRAIVPKDGVDLSRGDIILELEPTDDP